MFRKMFKYSIFLIVSAFLVVSLTNVANAEESRIQQWYHYFEETVSYDCEILSAFGTLTYFSTPLIVEGQVPDYVSPYEQFDVWFENIELVIPKKVVQDIFVPLGFNYVYGSLNKLEVISDNLPKIIKISNPYILPTSVPSSDDFYLPLLNVSKYVGFYQAGNAGQIELSTGNINITLQNFFSDWLTLDFNCNPIFLSSTFATIPIIN